MADEPCFNPLTALGDNLVFKLFYARLIVGVCLSVRAKQEHLYMTSTCLTAIIIFFIYHLPYFS